MSHVQTMPFPCSIELDLRRQLDAMRGSGARGADDLHISLSCANAALAGTVQGRTFRTGVFAQELGTTQTTLYNKLGRPLSEAIVEEGINTIDTRFLSPRREHLREYAFSLAIHDQQQPVTKKISMVGTEYMRVMSPEKVMGLHRVSRTESSGRVVSAEAGLLGGIVGYILGVEKKQVPTSFGMQALILAVAYDAGNQAEYFGQALAYYADERNTTE